MAETMFRYGQMRGYAQFLIDQAESEKAALRFIPILSRACFNEGDYYRATEYQQRLTAVDTVAGRFYLTLATYQMAAGEYDRARQSLEMALNISPDFHVARFNLALNRLITGDSAAARAILEKLVSLPPGQGPAAESRVLLADILRDSSEESEKEKAQTLYTRAEAMMQQALGIQPYASVYHLWAGLAAMGRGLLPTARDYLETADFLEARAFYSGLISLSLGKLSDLQDERDQALHHYREVLASPSAAYHQEAARRYTQEPYRQ
jgi:tetratricopeptide (TPR) repeat protein